jgi:hypothetical protein
VSRRRIDCEKETQQDSTENQKARAMDFNIHGPSYSLSAESKTPTRSLPLLLGSRLLDHDHRGDQFLI